MTIGPAGTVNTNVPPQNAGAVPPKQEQVGEFKEALNRSSTSNDAPGAEASKGREHSQGASTSVPIILATRPPINVGNQVGQQGASSQASAAPAAAPSQADPAPPGPAPAGTAPAGGAAAAAPVNPNLALATSLVKTGGSGTAEDAKLVAESLAKLPKSTLEQMQKNGTKVIACRDSVTDYRTDLKGVRPRGWPPGSTWDKVPGSNMRDKNEVVIAVTGHGTAAGPHVPKTGEGHGSVNLAAHEATHSIDRGSPSPSESEDFKKARDADMAKLPDYEKQAGEGGPRETYAESAARHAEGKDQDTPHLKKYWDDHQ
jgi:hypothetical protein